MKPIKTRIILTAIALILAQPINAATSAATLQLQSQIRMLENKVRALEAKVRTSQARSSLTPITRPGSAALSAASISSAQLNQINARLNKIMQVLQITSTDVTLKSPGNLRIESGSNININSAGNLNMEANLEATVTSTGITHIKGGTVKLNNGTQPVARVGSKTAGNPASQSVLDGSKNILVP